MKVAIQEEDEETTERMDCILNLFPDLKNFEKAWWPFKWG